jgi:hypothetical protein
VSWVKQIWQTVSNTVHELEVSLCQDN